MKLVFADQKVFVGQSFGAEGNVHGEVVFNTGMTGYVETLTDPSYCGQILVLTYPLQGNYGVPETGFESEKIQVAGLIVAHYSSQPSHFTLHQTLGDWLKQQHIPALCQVDTRTLTRYLREYGTAWGTLYTDESLPVTSWQGRDLLASVAPAAVTEHGQGDKTILLIDTGAKENIVRHLLARGVKVIRAPWSSDWERYLKQVDGIFLGNGPGDPMDALPLIERVRRTLDAELPIFGICFGNQLLAIAAGAKTVKMKYGHRSVNQPVYDLTKGKSYITSQNHGYVVQTESLPTDWQPWFINLNDETNEGIRHKTKPIAAVQFHPEASPGPHDTTFLFDDFVHLVRHHQSQQQSQRKA